LVFVPVPIGALREAHFCRPPREKGKNKKRGGGKKGTPPGTSSFLKRALEKTSATAKRQLSFARGEADTEPRK